MKLQAFLLAGVSLIAATDAAAQNALSGPLSPTAPETSPPTDPAPQPNKPTPDGALAPFEQPGPETTSVKTEPGGGTGIVVTGIRASLQRAAEIKRNAVQVVDSIVAQDIGKLPDPTTAAALQRVPGIQVSVDKNNELSGVSIRGLTDINTTVDGREVFTASSRNVDATSNSRNFDLKDVPAEALARVDVYKSQTADLIEGGVAGAIDLKLNKPFNFKKPTVIVAVRNNYMVRLGRSGQQGGLLATDRFDTGIGEIGVLVNGSYSFGDTARTQSNMTDRRSSGAAPLNTPGFLIPQVIQNMPFVGSVKRAEANAEVQWQAAPSLQVYVDGLFTYFKTTTGFAGFNPQPFTLGTSVTDLVSSGDCFQTRVNANGTNPTIINNANGTQSLQPFTVQNLCNIKSATFRNIVVNQNSSSDVTTQTNKMIAGGFNYKQDRLRAIVDVGYQTSRYVDENVNAEVGQRVGTLYLNTDKNQTEAIALNPSIPLSSTNLSLRNAFNQNFTLATGSLLQARIDGEYEVGGLIDKIQAGFRFARRSAVNQNVQQTTPIPFGNIGTASEARSRLVSTLPLSPDFIGLIGYAPGINGGTEFVGPNPSFLRSERGRNQLRALVGLPLTAPAYDPTHEFDATEYTYSGYAQALYDATITDKINLTGAVGVRLVKTDRTITSYSRAPAGGPQGGAITPVSAKTSDLDWLPNATAKLQLPDGFQLRFDYSKTLRRPDFASLNPVQQLTFVGNTFLLNTAVSGNPNLKPQTAESFDLSGGWYFNNGYVAVDGYYRKIKNRVVNSLSQVTIDGSNFLLTAPRNVGQADLKGIEASAQYFFKMLPGILSGFGLQGAFTYADSKIGGNDLLKGFPLQGVSKYNFTIGGLYDRNGLSARLIYTFRSKYYVGDNTGNVSLRPIDQAQINTVFVPTQLVYVRPAGRLDFSISYDVTPTFRLDVGGTNITRTETKQYLGLSYLNQNVYGDETTYTIGARVRF